MATATTSETVATMTRMRREKEMRCWWQLTITKNDGSGLTTTNSDGTLEERV